MKKEELLTKLKKINLPKNEYAVFGSGPLAIRNLLESNDIDIIVTTSLFKKLTKENLKNISYTKNGDKKIVIDDIEIFNTWQDLDIDTDTLIIDSEIIEEYPFVKLEYVIEWKKNRQLEKDLKDLELIKQFLKNN